MKKKLFKLSFLLIAILIMGITVYASEAAEITENMVMKVSGKTEVHESADDTSNVVATFEAGTPIIIQEKPQNGWCKVSYKESIGYVKTESLVLLSGESELANEFEQTHNQVQLMFDNIVLAEKEKSRSRIWGVIIVILVVLIFGVGIVSSIRGKKDKEKAEEK